MLARAHPESSIMNQRSSSIERCFAYDALMDDSVALINKTTTSNRAGITNHDMYPTDDVISIDWPHDYINANYELLVVCKVANVANLCVINIIC